MKIKFAGIFPFSSKSTLNANEEWKRKKKGFIIFSVCYFVILMLIATEVVAYQNFNYEPNGWTAFKKMWSAFASDISNLQPCWSNPRYGYSVIPKTFGVVLLIFVLSDALLWYDMVRHHHSLSGKESGSAKWNDDYKKFNAGYSESDKIQTTILSKDVQLSMNTRKTQRNNNVLIVGGSGAGKSRFFVKPNILQTNCNMVVTDPSGELLESTGYYLKQQGYDIKVFNLVEMSKSHCYNPFHYIRDNQGVMMMINCLIRNTTPPEQHSGDPFWEKSETALLLALCFYLRDHRPVEEQNFATVMKLLRWAEVDENNANFESRLDKIFLKSKARNKRPAATLVGKTLNDADQDADLQAYLERTIYRDSKGTVRTNIGFKSLEELDVNETDIAVKQYKIFKMGAGKTAKSILISCAVRLGAFNIPQVDALTRIDNIHLEELGGTSAEEGKKKQALFVIIPAADSTYNFLVSMMYSQLFETLYYVAETSPACPKKRLPQHVKFLLDEFANIGTIPEFTKKLATMRKYEISCSVILQNLAQIKTMYKDDWESIIGNCDSFVFLGGKEYTTLEYISKELGDQTITVKDRSMSARKNGDSQSYKQTSRKLMFPDELGNLPNENCVVMIRGLNPFYEEKYDYLAHPKYDFTSDANKDYSYQIQINNSARNIDTVVREAQQQIEASKKQNIERVVSIEDLIAANPSWIDYPNIYVQFKVMVIDDEKEENEKYSDLMVNDTLLSADALPNVDTNTGEVITLDELNAYVSDETLPSDSEASAETSNLSESGNQHSAESEGQGDIIHRKSFFDDEDDA